MNTHWNCTFNWKEETQRIQEEWDALEKSPINHLPNGCKWVFPIRGGIPGDERVAKQTGFWWKMSPSRNNPNPTMAPSEGFSSVWKVIPEPSNWNSHPVWDDPPPSAR